MALRLPLVPLHLAERGAASRAIVPVASTLVSVNHPRGQYNVHRTSRLRRSDAGEPRPSIWRARRLTPARSDRAALCAGRDTVRTGCLGNGSRRNQSGGGGTIVEPAA